MTYAVSSSKIHLRDHPSLGRLLYGASSSNALVPTAHGLGLVGK
jgi:hypothetical protein